MGDQTGIEWTGATWNPWTGCIKVSAGCKFCYMYRDKKRYGKDPSKVVRSAAGTFKNPLRWQAEVESGVRLGTDRLVFTCSWSDWFIKEADGWRGDAWDIIRRCPGLIFQILTKRPERISDHLPAFWPEIAERCWIGTSCEDQENADKRIPHLLSSPVAIRFLSCEPLIGAIDLTEIDITPPKRKPTERHVLAAVKPWYEANGIETLIESDGGQGPLIPVGGDDRSLDCLGGSVTGGTGITYGGGRRVDWVIVGCESAGRKAGRFADGYEDSARSLMRQCRSAGVSFFHKQMPINGKVSHDPAEWPEDLRVREFPATKAMVTA